MKHVLSLLMIATVTLAAAEGDYASWMGPHGTRSVDSGVDLVDSLADAKFVWSSEATFPIVYVDPSRITDFPITHYCVPSVADGLVYYVYPGATASAPLDEVLLEKGKKSKQWNEEMRAKIERGCRQTGDDMVYCVDAKTGKTVWHRNFEGRGASLIYNANYYAAPVVADGRVYIMGSYLWVYCLDAKTGKTIWETELTEARAGWQKHFNDWLAGDYATTLQKLRSGELKGYKEHYVLSGLNVCSPVLADGVLVCNDVGHRVARRRGGGGVNALVGLDAATGKQLWRLPHVVKNGPPPQRWVKDGKAYIICAAGDGFRCVDPLAGKQLWSIKAPTSMWGSFVVGDDMIISGSGVKKTHGMHAIAITPTGAERAWKLGTEYAGSYTTPAIYKGHVFGRTGHEKGITIFAAKVATGEVVKQTQYAGGNICNSFIIADNRLWFGWEDYINVDPASPDFMKQLAGDKRNPKLKRNGWASPSVSQGQVFYRQGRKLMCADFRK